MTIFTIKMSSHGSSSTSTPSPTPPTSKKDSNAIDRISSLLDNHFYEIRSMLLWSTIAAGIIALRSSTFGKRYTSAQEIPVHMFGRGKRIGGLFWLDSSNRHKQQLYFHHVPPLNRLVFGRPSSNERYSIAPSSSAS